MVRLLGMESARLWKLQKEQEENVTRTVTELRKPKKIPKYWDLILGSESLLKHFFETNLKQNKTKY